MKVIKILLCGLLMALPVFAEESDDRQTATSLHYVSHELDTRQDKLSAGSNKALTYTNAAGNVEQRTVKSNLTGGTTDTSLPMAEAVNAGLNQKQNDIATIDDHTAVTYTNNVGTIGQKGIYQTDGTYATQTDNLIDAKTFNAALKNALDSEFVCADRPDAYAPGTTNCWLWEIHNTYNVAAQPYISATGTVVQNGTPTPTNPIDPVFYRQGNMILRKVGDYADSYDLETGKITRRVGVKVLDGTEDWSDISGYFNLSKTYIGSNSTVMPLNSRNVICSHFEVKTGEFTNGVGIGSSYVNFKYSDIATTLASWQQWLVAQYAAGTPVTIWYPLATPVEEDWPDTTYNENVYLPQNQ